jgi:hypothetical protein
MMRLLEPNDIMKTTTKVQSRIAIRDEVVEKIKAIVPAEKHEAVDLNVAELNDAVNEIENSGRIQTTKDWYGDYLALATSKLMVNFLVAAGADRSGVASAARINGVI